MKAVETIFKGFTLSERTENLDNYISINSIEWINTSWDSYENILDSIQSKEISITKEDYIFWPLYWTNDKQFESCINIVNTLENITIILINGPGIHVFTKNDEEEINCPTITYLKKDCKDATCLNITCNKCFPTIANDMIKIIQFIKEKYSKNKTCCISGNLCVGRAMTFHVPELPFTKGFYANDVLIGLGFGLKSIDDIYQLIARICGSFSKQLKFIPKAYGSIELRNKVIRQENIATNLSNMESGSIIDKQIINQSAFSIPESKTLEQSLDDAELNDRYFKYFEYDDKIINQNINNTSKLLNLKKFQNKTIITKK